MIDGALVVGAEHEREIAVQRFGVRLVSTEQHDLLASEDKLSGDLRSKRPEDVGGDHGRRRLEFVEESLRRGHCRRGFSENWPAKSNKYWSASARDRLSVPGLERTARVP